MEKLSKERQKWIRSLQQKKHRSEANLFVVEGEKSVLEGLDSDKLKLVELVSLESEVQLLPLKFHEIVRTVNQKELESISELRTPNKFVAVFECLNSKLDQNCSSIVLDGVQDPGNLGTILRLADWFGIQQIICSSDTVDCYNSKVIQASMGAIFRVSVQYTDVFTFLSKTKLPVFGALLDGENYKKTSYPNPLLLVMGNEGKGIRPEIEHLIQHKITIPRIGEAESLNVSTATAILLAEICLK